VSSADRAHMLVPAGRQPLALDVQLNPSTGWGSFALNVLAELESGGGATAANDEAGGAGGGFFPIVTAAPHRNCARLVGGRGRLAAAYTRMLARQHGLWHDAAATVLALGRRAPGVVVLHAVAGEFEDAPAQHHVWADTGTGSTGSTGAAGGAAAAGAAAAAQPLNLNVGVCFFERDALSPRAVRHARAYDAVLAGSRWNLRTLRRHGVRHAALVKQGVDVALFAPRKRGEPLLPLPVPQAPPAGEGASAGRAPLAEAGGGGGDDGGGGGGDGDGARPFVIFSGGKLELRKGQDLVVDAFRRFLARHPRAVLATAWYNPWPETMADIGASPHVAPRLVGAPRVTADHGAGRAHLHVEEWLAANGVAPGAGFHLQEVAQRELAALLQRADVAVFPNRAEGGTNLVAMEAMAAGVPVVLVNATGQADVAGWEHGGRRRHCFSVRPAAVLAQRGLEGWAESSAGALLAELERAHRDRAGARRRGAAGAAFVRAEHSWGEAIAQLARTLRSAGAAARARRHRRREQQQRVAAAAASQLSSADADEL